MPVTFPDDDRPRTLPRVGPPPRPAWRVFAVNAAISVAAFLALAYGTIAVLSLIRRLL